MFCLSYKNHDFLAIFSDFAKKCSNEYIFEFPLAYLYFPGYVSRGWWVGDVAVVATALAQRPSPSHQRRASRKKASYDSDLQPTCKANLLTIARHWCDGGDAVATTATGEDENLCFSEAI